jgi:membrane protease YdiL (CAAX protease family)
MHNQNLLPRGCVIIAPRQARNIVGLSVCTAVALYFGLWLIEMAVSIVMLALTFLAGTAFGLLLIKRGAVEEPIALSNLDRCVAKRRHQP